MIIIYIMDHKVYHGNITPKDFARALIAHFHRGNLRVQQIGRGDQLAVQISSHQAARSGGQTALAITLQKVEDGVSVEVGKQALLGVAASLGFTALAALRNPINLLGRIDDIAQDIEYLQLQEEVWDVIQDTAQSFKAHHQLSERLRRLTCDYCGTANPVGEPRCIACGAPLGSVQPQTCPHCGFVVTKATNKCPNCGKAL